MKKIPANELLDHLKDHNSDKPEDSGVFQKYEESYDWDGCGILSHWLETDNGYPGPFKDDGDQNLFKED